MLGLFLLSLFNPMVSAIRLPKSSQYDLFDSNPLRNSANERILVAMADTREPELSALNKENSTLGYWTTYFLRTAQASMKGKFDYKYFVCNDGREASLKKEFHFYTHWCKVMVMNHIAKEGKYDKLIMIDSDSYAHSIKPGDLGKIFDTLFSQKEFHVPNLAVGKFESTSLAKKSIITEIGAGCGFETCREKPNKHCTSTMFVRMNDEAKAALQAWLNAYEKGQHGPCFDQNGLSRIASEHGSVMEAVGSGLVNDYRTHDDEKNDACKSNFAHNTEVLKDALGKPSEADAAIFTHRQNHTHKMGIVGKARDSAKDITNEIGEDEVLQIMKRSSNMITKIEIGDEVQKLLINWGM